MIRQRLAVTGLLIAAISLFGCRSGRSVAAYCQVFYGQGSQLRQQWAEQGQSGSLIDALGMTLGAPQQLANFFKSLDAVAPTDIESDVHQLQQAAQTEADALSSGNVLQMLASGFVSSLSSTQASNNVGNWTLQNCGPPPAG